MGVKTRDKMNNKKIWARKEVIILESEACKLLVSILQKRTVSSFMYI